MMSFVQSSSSGADGKASAETRRADLAAERAGRCPPRCRCPATMLAMFSTSSALSSRRPGSSQGGEPWLGRKFRARGDVSRRPKFRLDDDRLVSPGSPRLVASTNAVVVAPGEPFAEHTPERRSCAVGKDDDGHIPAAEAAAIDGATPTGATKRHAYPPEGSGPDTESTVA